LLLTLILKSVRELCVVSHCIFLNITNARIPHERGTRLRHIGPFGLKQAPSTGLGYGLDDRGIVLESRRQKRFSIPQNIQTGFGAHPASCFQCISAALAPKVTLTAHIRLVTMFKITSCFLTVHDELTIY